MISICELIVLKGHSFYFLFLLLDILHMYNTTFSFIMRVFGFPIFTVKQVIFQQQFFDSRPSTSAEGKEGVDAKKGEVVVGLITSSYNEVAFVWSSLFGRGVISLSFGERLRHGQWIKFIPT